MSVSGASSSAKWPAFSSSRTGPLGKAARKCVRGIFDGMARSRIPSASMAGFVLSTIGVASGACLELHPSGCEIERELDRSFAVGFALVKMSILAYLL